MADPFTRFTKGWVPETFPFCMAFGNEVEILRPELLAMAEAHVRIPMLGQRESLMSPDGRDVIYELLRKWRNTPTLKSQTPRF